MPNTAPAPSRSSPKPVAFQALPCGCVSGVYLAFPSIVELEMVEAKGPHCRASSHRTGRLVGMGGGDETSEN